MLLLISNSVPQFIFSLNDIINYFVFLMQIFIIIRPVKSMKNMIYVINQTQMIDKNIFIIK